MFCAACGLQIDDGDRFCKNCGASLQVPGHTIQRSMTRPTSTQGPRNPQASSRPNAAKNPYRDQIAQLRLQLKEARMHLRDLNDQITGTRSNYFELDSFVQRGLFHDVGRMIEGAQLFGPYQQRKQLQEQVRQLEGQLLQLEKAQEQWRLQSQ